MMKKLESGLFTIDTPGFEDIEYTESFPDRYKDISTVVKAHEYAQSRGSKLWTADEAAAFRIADNPDNPEENKYLWRINYPGWFITGWLTTSTVALYRFAQDEKHVVSSHVEYVDDVSGVLAPYVGRTVHADQPEISNALRQAGIGRRVALGIRDRWCWAPAKSGDRYTVDARLKAILPRTSRPYGELLRSNKFEKRFLRLHEETFVPACFFIPGKPGETVHGLLPDDEVHVRVVGVGYVTNYDYKDKYSIVVGSDDKCWGWSRGVGRSIPKSSK